jgi:hypothetical protein
LQEPVPAVILYLLDLSGAMRRPPGVPGFVGGLKCRLAGEGTTMQKERSTVFEQLKTFLTKQMRMSHLYQPLMLRTLVEKGDCITAGRRPSWRTTKARSSITSK